MVRRALEHQIETTLACDRFHNAERQVETFEHRALLDVKLQVSEGLVTGSRFVDSLRIQTERGDCGRDRFKQLIVDVTDESSASNKRNAESHAFFFRESDYFNLKRQAAASEIFDQGDSEHDTQDSIEGSRARDRVEVRSDEEPWCVRLVRWIDAPKISGMIHAHTHPRHFHPAAQMSMHLVHRLGQKCSRSETGLFGGLRKQTTPCNNVVHHDPR